MKLYTRFSALFSATILVTFMGACSSNSTSSSNEDDVQTSAADSTGAGDSSSSVESSSMPEVESSSSMLEGSSSSSVAAILRVPEGGLFRWVGADDSSSFINGLDFGTGAVSYWYDYDDGNSRIQWPVEVDINDYSLDPVITACQGLCGKFTMDNANSDEDPYVGVGLVLAEEDDEQKAVDISAWEGLCVAYSSTNDIKLLVSYGEEVNAAAGYNLPYVTLSKSTEGTVKCVPWNKGWTGDYNIEELIKKAVKVKFEIQGKSGTTGEFNIMSVGSYVEQ